MYDSADHILSGGPTSFAFDSNGRETGKTTANISTSYTFDALDRLTLVSTAGGSAIAYGYNGDGLRVSRMAGGTTTTYVQDLAAPVPVVLMETTGEHDTLYLYGKGVIAQFQSDGTRQTYHADALGSTRLLTDVSGAVVASYTYDAFGAVRAQTGDVEAGFTFRGQHADAESGLESLDARYYDPSIGRFLSREHGWGIVGCPSTVNAFSYASETPVTDVDAPIDAASPCGVHGQRDDWGAFPLAAGHIRAEPRFRDAAGCRRRTRAENRRARRGSGPGRRRC
jgi:RHS repeat-associated protein